MKRPSSPIEDERGAIMVIALLFAMFAVAILYLVIGAAEAVLFREHLQDAADSAALSGAITHARIMNVLVLINMVMVALLAILVTLKLIEGIAIVGMAIAAGLAWCTFGASLVAIPPLSALQQTMSSIFEEVKPLVFNALELLHDASTTISKGAPYIAEGMAQGDIVGKDDGIEAKGFGSSTVEDLPIEDDSFDGLCGKAGSLSWHIANIPLSVIPGWSVISGALDGPMHALTESLSDWFCGDGGSSSPDLSQNLDLGYPKTEKAALCESTPVTEDKLVEGQEKNATSSACDNANAEQLAAKPDPNGNCTAPCEQVAYDTVTSQARMDCDPTRYPGAKQFRLQIQTGEVKYKWNGVQWVRGQPSFATEFANVGEGDRGVDTHPCNLPVPEGLFDYALAEPCGNLTTGGFLPGYNNKVHPDADPTQVQPACTSECAPKDAPPETEKDPTRTVKFRQVSQVFGCVRHEKKQVDVHLPKESPNSEAKKQEGNPKSPKRIVKGVKLGDEQFQVRAVVVADQQQRASARLVRLGLWGRPDPAGPMEGLRKLGGFSLAQAEYYFSGTSDTKEWMWTMEWRGRLRRFELPKKDEAKDALRNACDRLGNIDCNRMLNLANDWKDLLVH